MGLKKYLRNPGRLIHDIEVNTIRPVTNALTAANTRKNIANSVTQTADTATQTIKTYTTPEMVDETKTFIKNASEFSATANGLIKSTETLFTYAPYIGAGVAVVATFYLAYRYLSSNTPQTNPSSLEEKLSKANINYAKGKGAFCSKDFTNAITFFKLAKDEYKNIVSDDSFKDTDKQRAAKRIAHIKDGKYSPAKCI